ncbi:hypothetical protein ASZ90_015752 [hydrocarbon metagenome]|uniref:Uncharacterized protein n=1 Tax=hydrocarbon metagenome TaxID=938273 RepID=A0A0W8F119_9ZZZZ
MSKLATRTDPRTGAIRAADCAGRVYYPCLKEDIREIAVPG